MESVVTALIPRRAVLAPVFWLKFAAGVSLSLFVVLAAKKAVKSLRADGEEGDTPQQGKFSSKRVKSDPHLKIIGWPEVYGILSALETRNTLPEGLTVKGFVHNTFAGAPQVRNRLLHFCIKSQRVAWASPKHSFPSSLRT